MDGLIVVDKPAGLTSHDVVLKIRKFLRVRKIGHAGTLDPMATGVLLVTVGQATRLFPYLSGTDKTYTGEIRLGVSTNTYDAEGQPEGPENHDFPPEKRLLETVSSFIGEISQLPPPFSAKKINGQPAFKLARKGLRPELSPVRVTVHRFLILDYTPPLVKFLVECSPGTYIRSLAHELGQKLGCGAHLSSLRRVASGLYTEEEALSLDIIEDLSRNRAFHRFLLPLERLLPEYPAIWLDEQGVRAFAHGAGFGLNHISRASLVSRLRPETTVFRVFSDGDRLLGLARFEVRAQLFRPELVLNARFSD